MSGTTSHSQPLIPGSVNHGCGKNDTIYWILIQSSYRLLEKLVLALQGIHVAGNVTRSLKRTFHYSIKLATSGLWEIRKEQ